MEEMLLRLLPVPARVGDQALDKRMRPGHEIDHATVRVTDDRQRADAADGDRVRDLEFARAQVRAAGAKNEGEVVGNAEVLAIVHAHPDEQSWRGDGNELALQVVVLEELLKGCASKVRWDVAGFLDWSNELVHARRSRLAVSLYPSG